jgi:hypothetical protein
MRERQPLLFLILLATGCSESKPKIVLEDRTLDLQKQLEQQRKVNDQALKSYSPSAKGSIADLSTDAAAILHQLPGVANVEIMVSSKQPTHRIIQLCDHGYVSRELYAEAMRARNPEKLSEEAIDVLYRQFLLIEELVHGEQLILLRCLVTHHGLREVFYDGELTSDAASHRRLIEAARGAHRRLDEFKELAKKESNDRETKREIETHEKALRDQDLVIGAVGRLEVEGFLEVKLLDDEAWVINFKKSGRSNLEAAEVRSRQDAMVKMALSGKPVAFVVSNRAPDLSASVRKVGDGKVDYIRVTTRQFAKQVVNESGVENTTE